MQVLARISKAPRLGVFGNGVALAITVHFLQTVFPALAGYSMIFELSIIALRSLAKGKMMKALIMEMLNAWARNMEQALRAGIRPLD